MTSSSYPNGLERIVPVMKTEVPWCPKRKKKVIAIDFGTSTLAVSYKTHTQGRVIDVPIEKAANKSFIPTVLLIKSDNSVEIGELALLQYTRLDDDDTSDYLFFDRVKLELQNDEEVGRRTSVAACNGRRYYLLEVIALILSKVREEIQKHFNMSNENKIEEFHWVLTIPALWGKRARDMMREAAYLAGLCSNQPTIRLPLRPTYTHYPPSVKRSESNPENLSLVYEPDAAAAWCRELTTDKVEHHPDIQGPFITDDFFLTVDIGGGTIDVTGHQILKNSRMKRVNLPHGEIYGGSIVNEAFKTFLGKEVANDPFFTSYLSGSNVRENRAELLKLVYVEFESTKQVFTRDSTVPTFVVQLPTVFAETYMEELKPFQKKNTNSEVVYIQRGQKLRLSSRIMKSFFQPNLEKVYECIDRAKTDIRNEHSDMLKVIYLVGGFGGCDYVASNIRSHYKDDNFKVIVPANPQLAVVRGACEYHEKNILEDADATYGIETCTIYDGKNQVHVSGKRRVSDDGTELYCEKLFQPIVQIGQKLEQDHVYVSSYLPLKKDQDNVTFFLYSTKREYVDYTYGHKSDCLNPIATVCIQNKARLQKKVELLLDFSSTEIQVYAQFEHSKERVNASVDFLSALNKFEDI